MIYAFTLILVAAAPLTRAHPLPADPFLVGTTQSRLDREREPDWFKGAGYSVVRRRVYWADVEIAAGVYNWTSTDSLIGTATANWIESWFTFTGVNDLYDGGLAPSTKAGQAAYVRWITSAAKRYNSSVAIFECWDQPNTAAWSPAPDAQAYAALCSAASTSVRAVAPNITFLALSTAPAADGSGLDTAFVKAVIAAGGLKGASGINVYLGRWNATDGSVSSPEACGGDIDALRALTNVPIYSATYSYATSDSPSDPDTSARVGSGPGTVDDVTQGSFVTRAWFHSLLKGVNVTVWGAWRDGEECGPDATATGCNLGVVGSQYQNSSMPYLTKPGWRAGGAPFNMGSDCAYAGTAVIPSNGTDSTVRSCYAVYWDCGYMSPGFAAYCDAPAGWSTSLTFPFDAPSSASTSPVASFNTTSPGSAVGAQGVCYWPLNYEGFQFGGLVCSGGDPLSWTLQDQGNTMTYLVPEIDAAGKRADRS